MSQLDVAIVGMACVFPGAPDLETYRRNIETGFDAITDMPPDRTDALFYDPASDATDRIYTRRGGFIDRYADFDPLAFGVMPVTAGTVDPDHMLALQVAERALADAGYLERTGGRERTSIILGRGGYVGPGMMRWVAEVVIANQLVETLRDVLPGIGDDELGRVKAEFRARTGVQGADSAGGLIPNLVASRIANRFDFGGSAYTLDAACASSLVAVHRACEELASNQADMVLAGGVHVTDTPTFWTVFSQLKALSSNQQIRPFDRRADGLLIGEGLGMLVLKRLADAERDGDRVYAVIRGSGIASDGHARSLLNPRVEGQVLAVRRAWEAAGLDPATVGLIEAHGTATVAGDTAELETLRRVFGSIGPDGGRAGLGSVKSMIGHTMPAAGAAGLIKAALAVYHGVLPPSLHCEEAHEALEATRFRLIREAEPWPADVRRAGVNAFGFGGINAHVVIDSYGTARAARRRRRDSLLETKGEVLALAAMSQTDLLEALAGRGVDTAGPWRIAITNPTPERVEAAKRAVEAGRERFGRDGIFFSPAGVVTEGGKVAFLFPGVEAQFEPDVEEVARTLGLPAPDLRNAGSLDKQGLGVFLVNLLYDRALRELGVRPDAVAGHSIGEWSGMVAAGMLDREAVERFIGTLQAESLVVPDVSYLAVGTSGQRAVERLGAFPSLTVSHDNCDHQSIVCGPDEQIEQAAAVLRAAGILCEVLPFRSGFHSPAFGPYAGDHVRQLARFDIRPASTPLWSATTCEPYPDEMEAVRELFGEHLVKPVRFRELVLRLYEQGVRAFVQTGPGRLTSFVDDVLIGKRHVAVSAAANATDGMEQLRRAAAELYVAGAEVSLEKLGVQRALRPSRPIRLDLGTRLIRLETRLQALRADETPAVLAAEPILAEFEKSTRAVLQAQQEVAAALAGGTSTQAATPAAHPATASPVTPSGPAAARSTRRMSVEAFPELLDHCLIPQAAGWPHLVDRRPTAPMTMLMELMAEAVKALQPGAVVIGFEDVTAYTWLEVEPAFDLDVMVEPLDGSRYRVTLGGFATGTVALAPGFPEAPAPLREALTAERPPSVEPATAYRERWLFHGPRYQGLKEIAAIADDGTRGQLTALAAKGGLLDCAGQLYGLWLATHDGAGRIAMPLRIRSVALYATEPAPGEAVECTVWIRQMGSNLARADLDLVHEGRVYARIEGWEDWLFETAGRLYPVYRFPERNLLATPHHLGFVVVDDPGWLTTTFDFLGKRFLSAHEREAHAGIEDTRRYAQWLRGRIAAKDAVRRLLYESGHPSLFPAEVEVLTDEAGRPVVRTDTGHDLRVSLAHKDHLAVAIAAEGTSPGIDIERVEARGEGFSALAFHPEELDLLPTHDRDAWLARLWAAKEAAGKASGSGLAGNPKAIRTTQRAGDRLLVDGRWVETTEINDRYVIAWTRQ